MQPDPYERFWKQLKEVCAKQPDKAFDVWPSDATPGSGVAPQYVYERGKILCRTSALPEVRQRLGGAVTDIFDLNAELTLLTLAGDLDVPEHVRMANENDGKAPTGYSATPNHLVSITPVNMCPADEPVPVDVDAQPWPPLVTDPSVGQGIEILVIDTGVIPHYIDGHPWLHGVYDSGIRDPVEPGTDVFPVGDSGIVPGLDGVHGPDTRDPFEPGTGVIDGEHAEGLIKEYACHGTFIAGVIGAIAPGARIRVSKALQNGGALSEARLGKILLGVLQTYDKWPDIISLSAGAPTMDGLPLMGLEGFFAELAKHPETVLIAAAGNDAERDDRDDIYDHLPYHFWPAAYAPHNPQVVSVGALARHHDGRACFSNHGTSVTVYARGEEHINAFAHGEYEYHHGLDPACHNYPDSLYCPCSCVTSLPWHAHALFQGMARWSGTSFATPLVAGMVAAYLTETGERHDARTAAHDLIEKRAEQVTDLDCEQLLAFL
jgi:subtilisin family serine protease